MAVNPSDALPEVSLQPDHTITVEFDDPAAVITELNVFALNLDTGQIEQVQPVPPLLAYEPIPGEVAA